MIINRDDPTICKKDVDILNDGVKIKLLPK